MKEYNGNPISQHCNPLQMRATFRRETREKITLISHHTDTKNPKRGLNG